MTHASVPEKERATLGISDTLIRLSVGLEDAADIIEDLDQALNAAVSISCHENTRKSSVSLFSSIRFPKMSKAEIVSSWVQARNQVAGCSTAKIQLAVVTFAFYICSEH